MRPARNANAVDFALFALILEQIRVRSGSFPATDATKAQRAQRILINLCVLVCKGYIECAKDAKI
jgi:hypothetical protein